MSDDIQITGRVDLVQIASTLNHVVKEMTRLGDVVGEEARETRAEIASIRKEMAELDKAQALTKTELRNFIAKVSAGVSALTALALWLIKSGVLAAML